MICINETSSSHEICQFSNHSLSLKIDQNLMYKTATVINVNSTTSNLYYKQTSFGGFQEVTITVCGWPL